ncbi:MAG: transporter substrate-binding domain-containing protein [Solobacterium sp.]|nr:transporter substrate-binding domain-containing protein [Solobacterium sp.]
MKKVLSSILTLTLALTLVGCSQTTSSNSEDHLARIRKEGKIKVGLEGDWQPFSFHNENDELVGLDVEIAKGIAEHIGVEAEIIEGPWDGLFAGMSAGTYDIVVNGVDITEERQKTYDFSTPYAYDRTVVVVAADNESIKSFEDLNGKTTANSIGSTYMEIGESYGATVSGVDTLAETMTMVINGQADATINANTSVQDYLKTTGETRVKVVAKSKDVTPYAIPLKKEADNESLLKAIDEALEAMRQSGKLQEISIKYFGEDLTNE